MTTEIKNTKYIKEFRDALKAGIEGMVRAAEIYVTAIDEDSNNIELFELEFADIVPRKAWKRFEAVGRKWIHPKMMLGGIADRKKNALIAKLPYSVQTEVFDDKHFEYLTQDNDTLRLNPIEATKDQVEQMISPEGTIRTLSEQKAWIIDLEKNKKNEDAEILPYTIGNGKVTFRRKTQLTRAEIKRILQEM